MYAYMHNESGLYTTGETGKEKKENMSQKKVFYGSMSVRHRVRAACGHIGSAASPKALTLPGTFDVPYAQARREAHMASASAHCPQWQGPEVQE